MTLHKYIYIFTGDIKNKDAAGMTGSTNTAHYGTGIQRRCGSHQI